MANLHHSILQGMEMRFEFQKQKQQFHGVGDDGWRKQLGSRPPTRGRPWETQYRYDDEEDDYDYDDVPRRRGGGGRDDDRIELMITSMSADQREEDVRERVMQCVNAEDVRTFVRQSEEERSRAGAAVVIVSNVRDGIHLIKVLNGENGWLVRFSANFIRSDVLKNGLEHKTRNGLYMVRELELMGVPNEVPIEEIREIYGAVSHVENIEEEVYNSRRFIFVRFKDHRSATNANNTVKLPSSWLGFRPAYADAIARPQAIDHSANFDWNDPPPVKRPRGGSGGWDAADVANFRPQGSSDVANFRPQGGGSSGGFQSSSSSAAPPTGGAAPIEPVLSALRALIRAAPQNTAAPAAVVPMSSVPINLTALLKKHKPSVFERQMDPMGIPGRAGVQPPPPPRGAPGYPFPIPPPPPPPPPMGGHPSVPKRPEFGTFSDPMEDLKRLGINLDALASNGSTAPPLGVSAPPLGVSAPPLGVSAPSVGASGNHPAAVPVPPLAVSSSVSAGPSQTETNRPNLFKPGDDVWTGEMTRGKKRCVVTAKYISGNVTDVLNSNLPSFTVSHRSLFEDAMKRPPLGKVVFECSSPLEQKSFFENVEYFTAKERAGVAAIGSMHLYLLPPGPEADKHNPFKEKAATCLVGLIVTKPKESSNSASADPPGAPPPPTTTDDVMRVAPPPGVAPPPPARGLIAPPPPPAVHTQGAAVQPPPPPGTPGNQQQHSSANANLFDVFPDVKFLLGL
eukprot:GHVL01013509.1.p1 GENE.GHVL01013509.1~~GHVL01013509.1.p1  ORF type:complete len:737 (+),score=205.87 GHVL01013509.1:477-2687(+)